MIFFDSLGGVKFKERVSLCFSIYRDMEMRCIVWRDVKFVGGHDRISGNYEVKFCAILWKSRGRVISGINRRPFCGPLCPGRLELSWSFLGRGDPRGRMELVWEWTRRACSIISLSISLYGGRPENGPPINFSRDLKEEVTLLLDLKIAWVRSMLFGSLCRWL